MRRYVWGILLLLVVFAVVAQGLLHDALQGKRYVPRL